MKVFFGARGFSGVIFLPEKNKGYKIIIPDIQSKLMALLASPEPEPGPRIEL